MVTIKKVTKTSVSVGSLLKQFQKDMGDEIGSFGNKPVNADRIPTGLFELDLAIGGGFPRGKVATIYGPESSNKTNIALLLVANHQKLWPDLTCVFVDLENEYNSEWAKKLGVNLDKMVLLRPSYGEQAVDLIEAMLLADDVGLVVLDSLAALVGTAELAKSADGEVIAGAAKVISKLYRKSIAAMTEADKRGNCPTLIYVNQITYKIGVMFGNPETTPGGKKPWYQSALMLRVHGNNIIDKSVSQVMPVRKEVTFLVRKHKFPILATSGKFEMVTHPHAGLEIGQTDDAKAIKTFLTSLGQFNKGDKDGWVIFGDSYKTQGEWKSRLVCDPAYGFKVRQYIIKTMLETGELIEGDSDEK